MMYFAPKETGFLEIPADDYICDTRFNHIQNVKPVKKDGRKGYLKPCKKCGHLCFCGFK